MQPISVIGKIKDNSFLDPLSSFNEAKVELTPENTNETVLVTLAKMGDNPKANNAG